VEGDNRRISMAALKATYVLLAEARKLGKPFLGQTFFQPNPPEVLSDQSAHIHAQTSAVTYCKFINYNV
jgi:hypothetical protein